jgi:metal-responsive CopG/Arc/MetJ family transcriptional regulator
MLFLEPSMERLQRTQIYLPPALSDALDRLAQRRGTSRAELLRQAAREFLQREQPVEDDAILGVVGLGNAGEDSIAEEHDQFLAGLRTKNAQR